jgi:hypothetical protein
VRQLLVASAHLVGYHLVVHDGSRNRQATKERDRSPCAIELINQDQQLRHLCRFTLPANQNLLMSFQATIHLDQCALP